MSWYRLSNCKHIERTSSFTLKCSWTSTRDELIWKKISLYCYEKNLQSSPCNDAACNELDYTHARLINQPMDIPRIPLTCHCSKGEPDDNERGTGMFVRITENGELQYSQICRHWLHNRLSLVPPAMPLVAIKLWIDNSRLLVVASAHTTSQSYCVNGCSWDFLHIFFATPEKNRAMSTLQWRHNGCDCVSNYQPNDCLLNCLFRRRSKKT